MKTFYLLFLKYLTCLSNKGNLSNVSKIAKVISIHKSGFKNDINNYRPISLLSALSKVLEKLVYNRLYVFLSKHSILFEAQLGF